MIGDVYMHAGMYDKAEEVLVKVYNKTPSNRRILSLLTTLYTDMGEYSEAEYYYKEFIFTMNIRKNQTESVFYQQLDGEIYAEEKVTTEQGIEVQLYEVKDSKNKKTCMGEFEYNDVYYYCIGMIPYNEMKNILKYLMILNN